METAVASSALVANGYARYDLAGHFSVRDSDDRFKSLLAEFDDLPLDPYAPHSFRHRRYGRGVLLPWTGEFQWAPDPDGSTGYFQGSHNPDYVDVVRNLPVLSERARANELLLDIIAFDFAQTRWSAVEATWPLNVGVHLIKLSVAHDGQEAISSPNELHQDGEPFVFAHLVYRQNAVGGGNVIARPKCRGLDPAQVAPDAILAEFELTRALESYGVTDRMVSHYVAPVRKGPGDLPGERAVVLVDFTPMAQQI